MSVSITGCTFNVKSLTVGSGAEPETKQTQQKMSGGSSSMDKMNKEEFLAFCRKACMDRTGSEFREFYQNLFQHFMAADHDLDGFIDFDQFEKLIEVSAANVRRLGLAPTTSQMYKSEEERKAARKKMFDRMDRAGNGRITFNEYLTYTFSHLKGKLGVSVVTKYSTGGDLGKDEFISKLKRAMDDRNGFEAKNLYRELFSHFEMADHDRDGKVDFDQFEALIEASAQQVRRLGLAPSTEKMYKSTKDRIAARKKMFNAMDTDKNGTITFNEYYNFTLTHIKGKINQVARESEEQDKAQEYVSFLKRAINNRNGDECKVFYREMFSHFMTADQDMDGCVKFEEFDGLIEASAAKVRRLGLAPSSKEMYKNDEERISARKKVFATMNKAGNGLLTFDEYVAYTWNHMRNKIQGMTKRQPAKV